MNYKKALCLLLTMSMTLAMTTGCAPQNPTQQEEGAASSMMEAENGIASAPVEGSEGDKAPQTEEGTVEAVSSATKEDADSSAPVPSVESSDYRLSAEDVFSERDMDASFDPHTAVAIQLSDGGISCASEAVSVNGSTVTITGEGMFLLTGALSDGQIVIEADQTSKIQLVLNNVQLSSKNSAPIYVKQADKVFVTIAEGTTNTLTTTEAFQPDGDTKVDGVIFSKDDLTIQGGGVLEVQTEQGHGVVSKDELTITGGTINVSASGHALSGEDSVGISGGVLQLVAGKDGIHSKNEDTTKGRVFVSGGELQITSGGDSVSASGTLQVQGGVLNLNAGGGSANAPQKISKDGREWRAQGEWNDWRHSPENGEPAPEGEAVVPTGVVTTDGEEEWSDEDTSVSAKGLKAGVALYLDGGSICVDAADDSLHSGDLLELTGAEVTASTGDDGAHADNRVTISGGSLRILTSYEGIEAGDAITINDGFVKLVSQDDGLNVSRSSGLLSINGGAVILDTLGDGLDSNGSFEMTGGTVYISGPTQNDNGGIDYDGDGVITGGTLLALSVSTFEQEFNEESTQGSILATVASTSGTVSLTDEFGTVFLEFTPAKEYSVVLVSCPGLTVGSTYYLQTGDDTQTITMDTLHYGSEQVENGFGGGGGGAGNMEGHHRPDGKPGRHDRNSPPEAPPEAPTEADTMPA